MDDQITNKKICFIIHSLGVGGMERVMSLLANYFSGLSHVRVHFILIGREREIKYKLSDKVIIHRPNFVFDDAKRQWHTFKTIAFLRKKVSQIDPYTILSFGEIWNNLVILALLGTNYPLYVSDRCQPDKSFGKFQDFLRRWLYPKASGIIAQTSKAKEVYEQQDLNRNIRIIGNPIYDINSNGTAQKEDIVLTVGRLIKTKHHDRLIKMFNKISSTGWKLVIVGGDALKQSNMKRLKKLVRELDMEETVEFTGTVSNIESFYNKSKIFAFTSSSEGFPNVIGEAMSAGLPVITYDCIAGPSDMVDNKENGFLIPLFDDEMYSQKLTVLMNDENLRKKMGKISKKKVEKFSIENIGEQYYSFIAK